MKLVLEAHNQLQDRRLDLRLHLNPALFIQIILLFLHLGMTELAAYCPRYLGLLSPNWNHYKLPPLNLIIVAFLRSLAHPSPLAPPHRRLSNRFRQPHHFLAGYPPQALIDLIRPPTRHLPHHHQLMAPIILLRLHRHTRLGILAVGHTEETRRPIPILQNPINIKFRHIAMHSSHVSLVRPDQLEVQSMNVHTARKGSTGPAVFG